MIRYQTSKVLMLGVIALAAEMTVLSTMTVLGARLELLLVLACFAALFARRQRQAVTACWILGLLKDIGSAGPPGLHALLFLCAGLLLFKVRQMIFREHPVTQSALVLPAAAAIVLIEALFVQIAAGPLPAGLVLGRSAAAGIFAALMAPVAIYAITRPKWLLR